MLKIFAHRGFVTENSPENSIAALKKANQLNFQGVEFDLWFFNDQFVIVHDQPDQNIINKLPNLKDFLNLQQDKLFWLDFKNLNQQNYIKAIETLASDLKNTNLSKIYFIPGSCDYDLLSKIIDYMRNKLGKKIKFGAYVEDAAKINEVLKFIKLKEIKILSIFHELINDNLLQKIPEVEIFAWTIKNQNDYFRLKKIGVKAFASDIVIS